MLLWTLLLRAATLQDAPPTVQWTDEMHKAFVDLKTTLISARALSLLDYTPPLQLYVSEKESFASALLMQKHRSSIIPSSLIEALPRLNVAGTQHMSAA